MLNPHRNSQFGREDAVGIETSVDGNGPALVVMPPYRRDSGAGYDDLTARLTAAGWRVLRPQPRALRVRSERVTVVVISDASHALFPEQPEQVSEAAISWAVRYRDGR